MRREDKWVRYLERHGLARIYARGISRQQVEVVLRRPDAIRRAKISAYKRFEKRISRRRRLAVIAEETSDSLIVITSFWT
jgi:hypothetical protein